MVFYYSICIIALRAKVALKVPKKCSYITVLREFVLITIM